MACSKGRPKAGILLITIALQLLSPQLIKVVAVIHQLLADLTDHALHLDMGFHKGTNPGTLIERIDGDVTALSNFISSMIINVLGNSGLLIGILILLWMESWMVGLRSRCSPQAHSWDSSGYTV